MRTRNDVVSVRVTKETLSRIIYLQRTLYKGVAMRGVIEACAVSKLGLWRGKVFPPGG